MTQGLFFTLAPRPRIAYHCCVNYSNRSLSMKAHFLLLMLSLGLFTPLIAQYTLSGYVLDSASSEVVIGAIVSVPELKAGTITNAYGFYSLTLPANRDSLTLKVDYPGYNRVQRRLTWEKDLRLTFRLTEKEVLLEEVVITDQKARENVERTTMGVIDLDIEEVELLPAIGGEVDLLKSLQLLPGVQSGTEASAGFYVRGGTADQNLILLDEALVYNPFHLAGFLSVFNTSAIKSVNLYKGSFPAQYGGRLSSILDISTKDGNMQSFHAEGGIGLIASRLMVEGPIAKDKASFMVSARRSYIDWLIRPFLRFGQRQGYYLQDINAKLNYRISDRDRIYLSGYLGRDQFIDESIVPNRDTSRVGIGWGNRTATLRWNHLYSDRLFSNLSLIYNEYESEQEQYRSNTGFTQESRIRDWTAKLDFDFYPNPRHQIKFGLIYTYHDLTPNAQFGRLQLEGGRDSTFRNESRRYINEAALYINDEIILTERIGLNLGLRFPGFVGDDTTYFTWEPRATLRIGLNENAAIKAGYTQMNQYLHQVASSAINNPFDFWIPSGRQVLPQRAHQVAVGYFQNFLEDQYETSVEVYYKTMTNQIDFREGTNPFVPEFEDVLVFGEGEAYGAEFYLRKRSGRLTGWVGYTLSWNWRQFDSLNLGEPFFFRYDRRHDLSVAMVYRFNERWSFSSVFIYGTGNAITLPAGTFILPGLNASSAFGQTFFDYSGKNGFRMPAYSRLDLGLRYTKQGPRVKHGFHIDIFNALNRRNPFFLYLDTEYDTRANANRIVGRQLSLLPMIPTLTYVFDF